MATEDPPLTVQMIGGPTALLTAAGFRILLDPTFSPPGDYESAPGRLLTKTEGPAVSPGELGEVDAVLLSHDQHVDNLDPAGRVYLETTPIVLTTPSGAERLGGNTRSLAPWGHITLISSDDVHIDVTAVPAQHGPDGTTHLTGEVTGFILTGASLPTVYVSGDNASLAAVSAVAERFRNIDLAVIFAGGAKSPKLLGDAYLTLTGSGVVAATKLLGRPRVVPVHYAGWTHFTEGATGVRRAFDTAGMSELLTVLDPGESFIF